MFGTLSSDEVWVLVFVGVYSFMIHIHHLVQNVNYCVGRTNQRLYRIFNIKLYGECWISFGSTYILWKESEYFSSRINLHWINFGWSTFRNSWHVATANSYPQWIFERCQRVLRFLGKPFDMQRFPICWNFAFIYSFNKIYSFNFKYENSLQKVCEQIVLDENFSMGM